MNNNDNSGVNDSVEYQATRDVAKRSLTGCAIYLVIWLMIILPSGFYKKEPFFSAIYTLMMLVFGFLRFLLIRNFERIYAYKPEIWTTLIYSAVIGHSLAWGGLCSAALLIPEFSPISVAIVISTAGLTAGGSAALAPDRRLSYILIGTLLIPGMVTILFFDTILNISEALLFMTFWIGMVSITSIQHKEYWTALKNAMLIRQHVKTLEMLNTQDGLTGIRNRKHFNEEIIKEIKRVERHNGIVSLLMMDLDHFKQVNDTYGHLAGDECLKMLAGILKNVFRRETDTVARYGGEEFAVILPDLTVEKAFDFAEIVRQRVETSHLEWNGTPIPLTISIGVSTFYPGEGMAGELLVATADEALYAAKKKGRNKAVIKKMI